MSKNQALTFKTFLGDKELIIETGKICCHSDGNCIVRCGETVVMVNVTMSKDIREGIDFFPLEVDFQEKLYSVGKIPGGFKRREGRGSDKAVLVGRLIDRSIRPLFPKGFYNGVNLVATALSIDPDVQPESLAMLGASFSLMISGIPFQGPTASVNIAVNNDEYIINPNSQQSDESILNIFVSGTEDAVTMIEAGAKEATEEQILKAIEIAHKEIKKLSEFQNEILGNMTIKKREFEICEINPQFEMEVKKFADKKANWILSTFDIAERQRRQTVVDKEIKKFFVSKAKVDFNENKEQSFSEFKERFSNLEEKYKKDTELTELNDFSVYEDNVKDRKIEREVSEILSKILKEKVRNRIVKDGIRPDGRKLNEVRPIWCEVGGLPRVHGTGIFTRGQTQTLTTLTLGTISDAQKLEGFDDEDSKRYMHQYNMPPYSTGEARSLRSPGRREIGHGALAEKALEPMIPSEEAFPYALRLVSEVLSSSGSTSMASVCSSTLALMDGGVPIKAAVSGVAMGLIKENDEIYVLTDIQAIEDFFGDMDFKVAGTENGITAIQMDIKIKGLGFDILKKALEEAKKGRLKILEKILEVIDMPREKLSKYAPKIITFEIDPEKIRDVIGSGGKIINKIISETGVKIDIEDNGQIFLAGNDEEMAQKAKEIILNIAEDFVPGQKLSGTVVKVTVFGAFIEFAPGKEGMIHISKLASHRVEKVEDIVNIGDTVEVEILKIDDRGRIDLKLIKKL